MLGYPIRTPSDHSSVDNSPRTIAASHVLHRLLMPRHPPCALQHFTTTKTNTTHNAKKQRHTHAGQNFSNHKTRHNKMLASTMQHSTHHHTPTPQPPPHPQLPHTNNRGKHRRVRWSRPGTATKENNPNRVSSQDPTACRAPLAICSTQPHPHHTKNMHKKRGVNLQKKGANHHHTHQHANNTHQHGAGVGHLPTREAP